MIAEPVLVYERGDTLDQRWRASTRSRPIRKPVAPSATLCTRRSSPSPKDLARPTRILLSELITVGLLRCA
jgi:hypothetical protein